MQQSDPPLSPVSQDQLLLSLRKEPRALVQNVNVDPLESWQEPGEGEVDFLQAQAPVPHVADTGDPTAELGLAPQQEDSKTSRALRSGGRRSLHGAGLPSEAVSAAA